MNINKDIANRALERAGQEPLNDEDIEKNTSRWRLIKSLYLPTILETLNATAWTSLKKRIQLEEHEGDNLSTYLYAYDLPADCAKPEELLNNEEYEVEGRVLYTNVQGPTLLYITNHYVGERYIKADPQPSVQDWLDYYVFDYDKVGYRKTDVDLDVYDENEVYYRLIDDEDYPQYEDFDFDPLLEEYIEARLASKIVLKITGDASLYQLLYNEAVIAERKALDASVAHSHSKENGQEWWADTLGLK